MRDISLCSDMTHQVNKQKASDGEKGFFKKRCLEEEEVATSEYK